MGVDPQKWIGFLDAVRATREPLRALDSGLHETSTFCDGDWLGRPLKDIEHAVNVNYLGTSFDGTNQGDPYCGIDGTWTVPDPYARNHPASERMDCTGNVLGYWAAEIDAHVSDTKLFADRANMQ